MSDLTAPLLEVQPPVLHGLALLPHLGVIRAVGEEAAKFLHNQLTQDFVLLGQSEARLAAFCNAKGRMQASFIGFKRHQADGSTEILLVCSLDLLSTTLKRLSMFVMRSKLKLSDATADFQVAGVVGTAAEALWPDAGKPWSKQEVGEASVVSLYPAADQRRLLWVAPKAEPLPEAATQIGLLSAAEWQWTEVRSGVATLTGPIFEAFVPQMLNFESVGGVNFKKGCYPGQEVVARSQFRGTLKRRAYLVHAEVALVAGQEIFTPRDAEQPCGLVVQAAEAPQGGWEALVSVQIVSVAQGLHLASADGAPLQAVALPYALLDDI